MNREEAIKKWIVPAIEKTWNDTKCKEIIKALEQEPCTVTGFADRCMECGKILGDMIKDAVSREEVMSMLHNHAFDYATSTKISALLKTMRGEVDRMPSVQPECTEDYCPAAFKPVECEDCISRQAAIDAMYGMHMNGKEGVLYDHEHLHGSEADFVNTIWDAVGELEELPPVTPAEKVGRWKRKIVDSGYNADWICNKCGYKDLTDFPTKYCPNCGAKMEEVKDD